MRRTDHDGHGARQGPPPFRVLAATDAVYLSPTPPAAAPPPPRAPEPYKVVPPTTSALARSHRRSSFVILAESKPASPEPGGGSPTLPTGRISPFRGRGFKGPPPHSMSRPQSPEATGDARRRKVERRVSVSQQNSPRRSLIPQPTYRQRSTSLTKANERSPSPKIGRRVDSKTRLNVSDSRGRLNASDSKTRLNDSKTHLNKSDFRSRTNLIEPRIRFISNSTNNLNGNSTPSSRRQTTTRSSTRLSPIQGTPTKPEKTNVRRKDSSRQSPTKTSRTSPQKNNNAAVTRRDKQNRGTSKERVLSPSKIPLKANVPSNTGRFISMPEQPKKTDRMANEGKDDKRAGQSVENGRSVEMNSRENGIENGNSSDTVDEINLRNLLKQTPHAIGTSSEKLVNTTTTTAVQPLHIDANALLIERNDVSTTSQQKEGTFRSSVSTAAKGESPVSMPNAASMSQRSQFIENQSVKTNNQTNNSGNDKKDSPVGAEGSTGGHSKSSSISQSIKSVRLNDESSAAHQRTANQSSASQRSVKHIQNSRGPRPSDGKVLEEPGAISLASTEMRNASVGSKTTGELPASDKMPTVMENDSKIVKTTKTAEATMNNAATMNNRTANHAATNNNTNSAIGAVNASANSGVVIRTRNENRGSDASLKSSTGVSTDSIESVRSTDTGVSVNTVRGVSSPREKTGVHMVKRSQEIETLSGNIVYVEQNGEPAVLTSNNEKQGQNEKLLARWGRSLRRYSNCCSGMRCLACRRDLKGLPWARNHGRPMVINDTPSPVAAAAHDATPPATNTSSCWSKLKARCRCTRLREIKCCTRKSRIAPTEPTVCCPPERRCGAICRRLFSRCNCKRADKQQRTRNTRAKHSLTSVAPPPVSEESKAKIPDVLVEHNSVMRGAIPCLPVPLAWFCLLWNVLLPGTGTVWSGLFNLCTGQPRFSAVAGIKSRLGAFIVNLIVGVGQLFTVLFCLVGWGWSIWWGVTMIRLARKYKRFKASEAANSDPEARGGGPLPPGVPSQALRGMERAR